MIGLTASDNWLLAIRTTLPDAVTELQERVAKLDAEKAECLALMHTYEDLIRVAQRHEDRSTVDALIQESEDYTLQGRI